MNKKKRALIVVGGTGGHVIPGYNLAKHLIEKNYHVEIVTDRRGHKYIEKNESINISILPSTQFFSENIFKRIFSTILIFYSVFRSIFFLIFNRPTIIFGMGGYATFPICIAAKILYVQFIIYENNLIIGKTNKYLLPFAKKIFVSYKELEGVSESYKKKLIEIGNIIDKKIINFTKKKFSTINVSKMNILILGGSQAAKIFAETLPEIFRDCLNNGIKIKIYQHCPPSQNESLKTLYEKLNIEFEIFNFTNNLIQYFSKADLAITRSGSSMLAELTNANIPFISVPLPSSADNHQLKNARFYQEKKLAFLIEEKDLKKKLLPLIKDIHANNSILNKIMQNQSHYSDKNVYNNINEVLEKIFNEKN